MSSSRQHRRSPASATREPSPRQLEAAEEIVRQLRLRDLGGIIVVDFIDMVLESNRELVMRRLVECLGRDRTRHQVAEVTSLGLVQMTRKRVGQGLLEAFSTPCETCNGRGVKVSMEPVGHRRSGGRKVSAAPVPMPEPTRRRSVPAPVPVLAPVPVPAPAVDTAEPGPAEAESTPAPTPTLRRPRPRRLRRPRCRRSRRAGWTADCTTRSRPIPPAVGVGAGHRAAGAPKAATVPTTLAARRGTGEPDLV